MIHDGETEALVQCTDLLRELSDSSKVRIIKYLIDRFNLQSDDSLRYAEIEKLPQYNGVIEMKNLNTGKSVPTMEGAVSTASGRSRAAKKISLRLVSTINLQPPKEKSLREFFDQYEVPKDYFEKNLLIIYYLEKILKLQGIGLDHIYTCYKNVGLKMPANLHQSLLDTKRKKGWIESGNINDLKVSVEGEIVVEYELPRIQYNVV